MKTKSNLAVNPIASRSAPWIAILGASFLAAGADLPTPSAAPNRPVSISSGVLPAVKYGDSQGASTNIMPSNVLRFGGENSIENYSAEIPRASKRLFEALDEDHDGSVSLSELNEAAMVWFKRWDTDTNGTLSRAELLTGMGTILQAPEPAHGASALAGYLSAILFFATDADKSGAITTTELRVFLADRFGKWDSDGSESLSEKECNRALAQFALPEKNADFLKCSVTPRPLP
jgi:hypothetical protein